MKYILTLLLACIAMLFVVGAQENSSRRHPFTPRNYPGIIFRQHGILAFCNRGQVIFICETQLQCPADAPAYIVDKDWRRLRRLLDRLKRNPNDVYCRSSNQVIWPPSRPGDATSDSQSEVSP
ncbi:hypothetical protein K493DRAFT_295536 [Basidiobolus meristosporus CBS 931.73]|uniref:Uncharacterized protein n=1 Tax=Basidiobolus meristosporus CBS 931.73 TaxID=1314790 RepID=A0A1Y1XUE9_9FUNG|nr:hypothetical protein K493DRAFT_305826 [Basidiobolus meristosporus CBS 931.73]ORY07327.1 hypothetical protein K493DRAFT_295536 [Basidiobolus meristosporus CBS 931.73]|eukprot:ORX89370.1 hypothetical protein K493DRAFT_305826 [Basidiobolus meristosporus CBS 931.73]